MLKSIGLPFCKKCKRHWHLTHAMDTAIREELIALCTMVLQNRGTRWSLWLYSRRNLLYLYCCRWWTWSLDRSRYAKSNWPPEICSQWHSLMQSLALQMLQSTQTEIQTTRNIVPQLFMMSAFDTVCLMYLLKTQQQLSTSLESYELNMLLVSLCSTHQILHFPICHSGPPRIQKQEDSNCYTIQISIFSTCINLYKVVLGGWLNCSKRLLEALLPLALSFPL